MPVLNAVSSAPASALPASQETGYSVQRGDTLSAIASQHGVPLDSLLAANPQIRNPNVIYPGQQLSIPGGGSAPALASAQPASVASTAANGSFDYNRISGVSGNPNVTPQFIAGVEAMAARLGTKPEFIMATMSFETGGSFSPSVKNPVSTATGLIQFLDSTARGLGTSTAQLSRMSSVEQLQYVEKYFTPFTGRLGTLEAVYTAVLSGSPKPDPSITLFSAGSNAYAQNRGLDLNGDGRITAGEATSKVRDRISGDLGSSPAPAPKPGGSTPVPQPSVGGNHTVRSGETMSGIAQKHGVSLGALVAANPQVRNPNVIHPGQTLHLPGASNTVANHVVQRGETMSGIAQKHGVSLGALVAVNPQVRNPNVIHPGQTLHVPGAGSGGSTVQPAQTHVVQRGENMASIAQNVGVSVAGLIAANPQVSNPNLIYPGQQLNIPAGGHVGSPPVNGPSGPGPSAPVGGGNPASIAAKFIDRNASELKRSSDLPMNPNVPSNLCCANFVSAVLEKAGLIKHSQRSDSVAQLNVNLRNAGWQPVAQSQAKPGDVVIIKGGGMSHTEIVASNNNGKLTFIGSNNRNADGSQRISYDSGSWFVNSGHATILTPPR